MLGRNAPIVTNDDLMNPGHLGCPGCGATIAMKFALQALGKKTMVVIPACCWGVIAGPYPQSALQVPILHTAFATAGAAASGHARRYRNYDSFLGWRRRYIRHRISILERRSGAQ